MKVKLTYFKTFGGDGNLGGKYYAEGEFETKHDPTHYFNAIDEVVRMRDAGRLPGLVAGSHDWHILVMTDPDSAPHLLVCPRFVNSDGDQ